MSKKKQRKLRQKHAKQMAEINGVTVGPMHVANAKGMRRSQERGAMNGHASRFTESMLFDDGAPVGTIYDEPDSAEWINLGSDTFVNETSGVTDEIQLQMVRQTCRYVARKAPYCINAIQNRISYVMGYGHTYIARVIKGMDASEDEVMAVQKAADEYVKANRWQLRQREIMRRFDRDGEVFLWYTVIKDKETGNQNVIVRFIEPGDIGAPVGALPEESFGVKTDPDDVESVEAYYNKALKEWIPADEVQHRKANVDCNVKRGMPLFWPVVDIFREVRAIRRNMARGSSIQTSVSFVKKVAKPISTGPGVIRSESSNRTRVNPQTGKTEYVQDTQPGRIITATDGIEYDFPFSTTNYSAFVEVIQNSLREVASMLCMPEFMFTSDASNGNYASTMVAEGPAVRHFEGIQYEMRTYDLEIMERQIALRIKSGELPEDILERVEIDVVCPQLAVREPLPETQRRQLLYMNKVLSPQTWASEEGYDYEQEQENIEQHAEQYPDSQPSLPLDPNGDPVDNGDGGDNPKRSQERKTAKEWIEGLLEYNQHHDRLGRFAAGDAEGREKEMSKTLRTVTDHWEGTLSHEELDAIKWYTQPKLGLPLNRKLRADPYSKASLTVEEQKNLTALESAIDKYGFLPEGTVVYRGLNFKDQDGQMSLLEKFQPGNTISLNGMNSTTLSAKIATGFTDGREDMVLRIKAKTGMYVDPISARPGEKEILQHHHTLYKVLRVGSGTINGVKRAIIDLKEV